MIKVNIFFLFGYISTQKNNFGTKQEQCGFLNMYFASFHHKIPSFFSAG